MKLFISSGIWDSYPVTIQKDYDKNKTRLCIYNMANSQKGIFIEIPVVPKKGTSWNDSLTIKCSNLTQNENEYIFEYNENEYLPKEETDNCFYALLFPRKTYEAGEVYISKKHKNNITVLEKIEFAGHDLSKRKFVDKMYFVRIDLSIDEPICVFLSKKKTEYFNDYVEFYKNPYLQTEQGKTAIKLNEDYIALSEL